MSVQRLSPRAIRRIERATGEDVAAAWTHGQHHLFEIVVADPDLFEGHRHGTYDNRDHGVTWAPQYPPIHYTSCVELFPLSEEYA